MGLVFALIIISLISSHKINMAIDRNALVTRLLDGLGTVTT